MNLSALPAALVVVVTFVIVAALASAPATPVPDEMKRHYRWGGLYYYNELDADTFVPKRYGVGFTLNFARWTAWLCLAVFVAIPMAAAILMVAGLRR